jgi:formate dehydrogenase iron-sulfur subunit
MTFAILVNVDECTGCHACTAACKIANSVPKGISFTRVISVEEGSFPLLNIRNAPVDRCMHCLEPECVLACPVDAIAKHEEGPVVIDEDECIGCELCFKACPFHVPKFDKESKKRYKCTMCYDRVKEGLEPACVEVCPQEALKFGDRDELLREAREWAKYVYGETEAGGTSLIYASKEPIIKLGLPEKPASGVKL